MKQKTVGVIGCGPWAMAIAKLLFENNQKIKIWCHSEAVAKQLQQTHQIQHGLPFCTPVDWELSTALHAVMDASDYLVFGVASPYVSIAKAMVSNYRSQPVLILTKGLLDQESHVLVYDYLKFLLGTPLAVLSGPNLADEILAKKPAACVIASQDHSLAQDFQKRLSNERFRVYTDGDVYGVSLGGILKNIMAIAAGVADGLNLGANAKAALLVRSVKEIVRFGVAMGAIEETFYGLSGIGDLMATCGSEKSRNWQVGHQLSQGHQLDAILGHLGSVAEGVRTTRIVYQLAQQKKIVMPITEQVYALLYEGKTPQNAIQILMGRDLKKER